MTTDRHAPAGINYLELTFALMGGALAWVLRLIINSALVDLSCTMGTTWPLWLSTAAFTAVAGAALWISWRYWRLPEDGPQPESARWLGFLGVLFNITSITGIVFETAPALFIDVCRGVSGV